MSSEEAGPSGRASDIDGVIRPSEVEGDTFPVVGIGASAGGLRAFQEFFAALPAQPGMAFVLVQHLSPDHESALAALIQTQTQMEVTQVTDHPRVEPNRVYVIPPGKHLKIKEGQLQLVEAHRDRGRPAAVDQFFRSLADDMGERAVCVVLSGTGSDGSLGLKAIKERAGLTMAQTPTDAEHDGMPRSAIGTDLVDVIGSAADLAQRLVSFRDGSGRVILPRLDEPVPEDDHQALQAIFAHLRERTAHDFSHYKKTTILRRLARRLQVTGQADLPAYAAFLRADPDEVQALLRDFLISVTQFFRDAAAFEVLESTVIPALFEGKGPTDQVRVWVAGCATGEEAYSVAMLLCEHRDRVENPPDIQVFATDIDEDALARAREGHYPEVAAADISSARLQRFFDTDREGVRVKPGLRQIVLFARHNLLSDPPFSRLDLVTCRNVLIYLNRSIQDRVFATIHYALRPAGWLFLGTAEGPGVLSKGFAPADKSSRIYRRRDTTGAPRLPVLSGGDGHTGEPPSRDLPAPPPREGLVERYRDWTLEQYAPPRLLVDEHYDVTHVFGHAGQYLRDREGPVSQNVVDKVVQAFRIDLRSALFQAFSAGRSTDTPFKRVEVGGREHITRLHVGPVGGAAAQDGQAEVVFIELDPETVAALGRSVIDEGEHPPDNAALSHLEEELRQTRRRLQVTVEESEASTEELRASNEEFQSLNEELQSTTEELETSKEELQSTNEELQTVNQELKNKLEELSRANADLQNLIASTDIATLFLDRSLRLKRYTPRAADLYHVIPTDIGRPFDHLSHRLRQSGFADIAKAVLETRQPQEIEAEGQDGAWYVVRISPYHTAEEETEGVVLTFIDVTDLRVARDQARRRADQQHAVVELGLAALEDMPEAALFDLACESVSVGLDAEFAKVLRYRPDESDLFLEAGVGWTTGLVGAAAVPNDDGSQGGYTFRASEPVVVQDLTSEARFQGPPLLTDHGVRSGISVPIAGRDGTPWGVLGVHSTQPQTFSEDDAQFVTLIANVLADAIRRTENERTIQVQLAEIEAVYDTAPVGLAFYDQDLRYRRINGRLAEINGVPVEQHIGRSVREVVPSLADQLEPILNQVMETGEPVLDLEIRGATAQTPDAERVWLCSYVPETVDGETLGVSVVVRDITDRKRTEEERTAALAELAFVLEGARVGVWTRDIATDALTLDERATEIIGADTYESAMARVHPDDVETVKAELAAAVEAGDPDASFHLAARIQTHDGTWRWVEARGRYLPDRGTQGVVSGILYDVTNLRRAETDLRALTAQLETRVSERTAQVRGLATELTRAEEAERQRIAHVIHDDLQQILFGVQVTTTLMARTLQDDAALTLVAQCDELIGQAIRTARTLSVDLSPPVLQDEGLGASFEWLAHRVADTHGLTVTVDGDAKARVESDLRTLLVRVVGELLFNVSKHAETDRASIRITSDPSFVHVTVSDEGVGFDPEATQEFGFGLASVRRRLTLIGGNVTITSTPGSGTTVTLTCPASLLQPSLLLPPHERDAS